jgi:hypothetical protein
MMLLFVVLLLNSKVYALDVVVGLGPCNLVDCSKYYRVSESDAHPKIQEALDDVRSAKGGKVQFLPGTYIVSDNMVVYSNTVFQGAGMNQTILKLKDYASPWKVGASTRSGFIRSVYKEENKCENIAYIGMTLDGNKNKQNTDYDSEYGRYGLFTEGCKDIYIDDMLVRNWQGYGFDPHGWKSPPSGSPIYGTNLTITNCIAELNDWDGFTLDQTDGIVISNCYAVNNGRHGYNVVTGAFNVNVSNVKSYNNGHYYYTGAGGCGIMVQNNQNYNTRKVNIFDSTFKSDEKGGVCTDDVHDIVVERNKVIAPKACFRLVDTWDIVVKDNMCDSKLTRMYQLSNTTNLVDTNNSFFVDTSSETQDRQVVVGLTSCNSNCENYFKAENGKAQVAIQKALDAVYNRGVGSGVVLIKTGLYVLSSQIEMYSNTHLVGEGMDKTILKLKDYAVPWVSGTRKRSGFVRSTIRYENKCENIKISHLTLDGNKNKQNTDADSQYGRYGWFTEGCTNLAADSVKIINWQGYGFDPHGWKDAPTGPLWAINLTIINSVAENNDWDGFTLDQTDGIFLDNCISNNNGRHGFNVVTGARNVLIQNSRSNNNGYYYYTGDRGCGMTVQNNGNFGTRNVVMLNNVVVGDARSGFCVNSVINVVIDKSNVNTSLSCFRLSHSRNTNVTNNVCISASDRLFQETNMTNTYKHNNTLVKPNTQPIETTSDPTCANGIRRNNICCSSSCGQCGGTGCASFPGGSKSCCTTAITNSGVSCNTASAPCIIQSIGGRKMLMM